MLGVKRFLRLPWWLVTLQLPHRLRELRTAHQIRGSGLFDASYYMKRNPDVEKLGIDPVLHYVRFGAQEGRDPNSLFLCAYYLEHNPDVARSRDDPLLHFIRSGAQEGRNPNPFFDTRFYLQNNPFADCTRTNPLLHYLRVGAASGRNPHPMFDTAAYLQQNPEVARAGLNPLVHYLTWGKDRGLTPRARRPEPFPAALDAHELRPVANRIGRPQGAADPVLTEPGRETDTAIVLHLYYLDLWEEIRGYLDNIDRPFDLFVSLCAPSARGFETEILKEYPQAHIRFFENRGRDMGPFLEFLNSGELSAYRYACKIHTKRSPHRGDGEPWRGDLLRQLLGRPEIVAEIRRRFDRDPDIGIIGPENQLDEMRKSWGSNQKRVKVLARRMGLNLAQVRLSFFAGSMFWFRPAALEPLKKLDLHQRDFEAEEDQLDGTLAHAIERIFCVAATAAGFRVLPIERGSWIPARASTVKTRSVRLIAFYLPQFHPIPENDRWWGKGFTEWTLVSKQVPLYPGHLQPRLPADLSFYDLRLTESRLQQADLARQYGIHGFCYYYYWFDGKRLLERPLSEVLRSGNPDLPFCICWANENWTRRWDGQAQEILMPQSYSEDSGIRFIRDVIPILKDPRYIRYQGRPVLVIYRAKEIPNLSDTVEIWRRECVRSGVGQIHLCAVHFWDIADPDELLKLGFDAVVEFPPHHLQVKNISRRIKGLDPRFKGLIYDYSAAMRQSLALQSKGRLNVHRGVMLGWDNTARRGLQAHIAYGATPELYRQWLSSVLQQQRERRDGDESLIFINAWNEWSEGATLEPDQFFGLGYLEATRSALLESDTLLNSGGSSR